MAKRKQEEIRKGLKTTVDLSSDTTDEILRYLHSQGVVIKVDRELPELRLAITEVGYDEDITNTVGGFYSKAGYVATEPLIEE